MIFNWTDTRGDRFAVADTDTEGEARDLVRMHAYGHYIEEGMSIADAHQKAAAFARGVELRALKRSEFAALCERQRAG